MPVSRRLLLALAIVCIPGAFGLERPELELKIFQFPADQIPRIDGDASDWAIVPDSYAVTTDELRDTVTNPGAKADPKSLQVSVKVGWVKGINQLYFLYEAYDDYWDFARADRHNDIFELVVDGDLSSGPFIRNMHPNKALEEMEAFFLFHGVHAQNYHIMTPNAGQDWAFVWGSQPWVRELPWANAAYSYDFKPGESGKLTLELWITPFDYAPPDPARAVVSKLEEGATIGMSWAILDYDDVSSSDFTGFFNLSHHTQMYGDADKLVAFRLMPLEERFRKALEPAWSFQTLDMKRRLIAFQDLSYGDITAWRWDFGDGTTSDEQHPLHAYDKPGDFVVTLVIEGPAGKASHTSVRSVAVK